MMATTRNLRVVTSAVLVCLLLCATQCLCFFDFLKSKSQPELQLAEPLDPARVRGVADHQQQAFSPSPSTLSSTSSFYCDGGSTAAAAVNDGYCDCRDGSDEPGTSACSGSSSGSGAALFHCVNSGFRGVKIPTSRVDDGVCDCCDGSDEGVVTRCFNTCQQAADRERSAMEKMLQAYRVGSSLREHLISTAKEDRLKLISQIEPVSDKVAKLRDEISSWEEKVDVKERAFRTIQDQIESGIETEMLTLLKVHSSPLQFLVPFLSSLMQVADIGERELRQMVSFPIPPSHYSQEGKNHLHDHHDDDDEIHNHEPETDSYGDETLLLENEGNEGEDDCDIVTIAKQGNHNGHGKELRLLCHAPEKEKELAQVIYKVVKKHNVATEAMYLLGYQQLNLHFIGSVEFAKNQLSAHGQDSCPADFEVLEQHCDLKAKLTNLIDRANALSSQQNTDSELPVLRDEVSTRRTQLRELEKMMSDGEKAQQELEKYKDNLDLLAMKGQCFEVIDGKFSYNLCMLENIRQKEIEGNGNVSLGEFEDIRSTTDAGASFKLHFNNGQYCHAFGPRTADVTVVCGDKNVLKAAREPSTCYYTLVLESPAACTADYALAAGLTPYL